MGLDKIPGQEGEGSGGMHGLLAMIGSVSFSGAPLY